MRAKILLQLSKKSPSAPEYVAIALLPSRCEDQGSSSAQAGKRERVTPSKEQWEVCMKTSPDADSKPWKSMHMSVAVLVQAQTNEQNNKVTLAGGNQDPVSFRLRERWQATPQVLSWPWSSQYSRSFAIRSGGLLWPSSTPAWNYSSPRNTVLMACSANCKPKHPSRFPRLHSCWDWHVQNRSQSLTHAKRLSMSVLFWVGSGSTFNAKAAATPPVQAEKNIGADSVLNFKHYIDTSTFACGWPRSLKPKLPQELGQ